MSRKISEKQQAIRDFKEQYHLCIVPRPCDNTELLKHQVWNQELYEQFFVELCEKQEKKEKREIEKIKKQVEQLGKRAAKSGIELKEIYSNEYLQDAYKNAYLFQKQEMNKKT